MDIEKIEKEFKTSAVECVVCSRTGEEYPEEENYTVEDVSMKDGKILKLCTGCRKNHEKFGDDFEKMVSRSN